MFLSQSLLSLHTKETAFWHVAVDVYSTDTVALGYVGGIWLLRLNGNKEFRLLASLSSGSQYDNPYAERRPSKCRKSPFISRWVNRTTDFALMLMSNNGLNLKHKKGQMFTIV